MKKESHQFQSATKRQGHCLLSAHAPMSNFENTLIASFQQNSTPAPSRQCLLKKTWFLPSSTISSISRCMSIRHRSSQLVENYQRSLEWEEQSSYSTLSAYSNATSYDNSTWIFTVFKDSTQHIPWISSNRSQLKNSNLRSPSSHLFARPFLQPP